MHELMEPSHLPGLIALVVSLITLVVNQRVQAALKVREFKAAAYGLLLSSFAIAERNVRVSVTPEALQRAAEDRERGRYLVALYGSTEVLAALAEATGALEESPSATRQELVRRLHRAMREDLGVAGVARDTDLDLMLFGRADPKRL